MWANTPSKVRKSDLEGTWRLPLNRQALAWDGPTSPDPRLKGVLLYCTLLKPVLFSSMTRTQTVRIQRTNKRKYSYRVHLKLTYEYKEDLRTSPRFVPVGSSDVDPTRPERYRDIVSVPIKFIRLQTHDSSPCDPPSRLPCPNLRY